MIIWLGNVHRHGRYPTVRPTVLFVSRSTRLRAPRDITPYFPPPPVKVQDWKYEARVLVSRGWS